MATVVPSHISQSEQYVHNTKQREKYKKKSLEASEITLHHQKLKTNPHVHIRLGPVIGAVTATTAIVLLEITTIADISAHLVPIKEGKDGKAIVVKQRFPDNKPDHFVFHDLKPSTQYHIVFSGVSKKSAKLHVGSFTTFAQAPTTLNLVAVSCDRPERQLAGETNMWRVIGERIDKGEVDLMLHVGDQVYAEKESVDAAAIFRHSNSEDVLDALQKKKAEKRTFHRAKDRLRDIYRYTWNLPYTKKVLATVPHLMIWSDNDIFNDFTIAKGASPVLIHIGQQTYREYQRALWDENIHDDHHHAEEQHFHKYGNIGIFVIDMRGNRIDTHGNQFAEKPLISDNQWAQYEAFLADPELTAVVVASEIPFVSDPPEVVKKGALKIPFLVDHWAYNDAELFRLLDKLFDWKAASGGTKDAVLIGGDIHVGVDTWVHDKKTGVDIRQITTSPITNHVCEFFPKREGDLSERYSYKHTALDLRRNYGYFKITATPQKGEIVSELIGGEPTAPEHH